MPTLNLSTEAAQQDYHKLGMSRFFDKADSFSKSTDGKYTVFQANLNDQDAADLEKAFATLVQNLDSKKINFAQANNFYEKLEQQRLNFQGIYASKSLDKDIKRDLIRSEITEIEGNIVAAAAQPNPMTADDELKDYLKLSIEQFRDKMRKANYGNDNSDAEEEINTLCRDAAGLISRGMDAGSMSVQDANEAFNTLKNARTDFMDDTSGLSTAKQTIRDVASTTGVETAETSADHEDTPSYSSVDKGLGNSGPAERGTTNTPSPAQSTSPPNFLGRLLAGLLALVFVALMTIFLGPVGLGIAAGVVIAGTGAYYYANQQSNSDPQFNRQAHPQSPSAGSPSASNNSSEQEIARSAEQARRAAEADENHRQFRAWLKVEGKEKQYDEELANSKEQDEMYGISSGTTYISPFMNQCLNDFDKWKKERLDNNAQSNHVSPARKETESAVSTSKVSNDLGDFKSVNTPSTSHLNSALGGLKSSSSSATQQADNKPENPDNTKNTKFQP